MNPDSLNWITPELIGIVLTALFGAASLILQIRAVRVANHFDVKVEQDGTKGFIVKNVSEKLIYISHDDVKGIPLQPLSINPTESHIVLIWYDEENDWPPLTFRTELEITSLSGKKKFKILESISYPADEYNDGGESTKIYPTTSKSCIKKINSGVK